MSGSPSKAIATLRGTSRTGRCHNAYFRQEQLKSLHDTLRTGTQSIISAIRHDTNNTDAEACIEVATALKIVKEHHESINPKEELEAEYRIAQGENALQRTEPIGVIYLENISGHTPFLAVVSPLSAALAAGNCIALKLENTLRALPSILRTLFIQALDPDIFQVVSSTPPDDALAECLAIFQDFYKDESSHTQYAYSTGRVVAVVDRTADLSSAAEALVAARFSFGGTSPYAPDLVLVNEFSKRDFLEHVLHHAIRYTAASTSTAPINKLGSTASRNSDLQDALASLQENKNWQAAVLTQWDAGAILDLTNTHITHVPLPPKLNAPVLCVSAISSLDYAIDLIAGELDAKLIAAYHFASPTHAKYLAQFIHADVSFVNHIPQALLLGSVAPSFQPFDLFKRYNKNHFIRKSPVIIKPLDNNMTVKTSRDASKFLAEAAREIKSDKRAEWIAIGYFEQGILIGLGIYGIPLLTCLSASLFFGVRAGLRRWAII